MSTKLFLAVLIVLYSAYSCDSNTTSKKTPVDLSKDKLVETPIDTLDPNTETDLALNIDRDKARKFGLSVAHIGSRLRELMLSDKSLTIDQVLDTNIIFQNNKGKWIDIPIRSILIAP